MSLVTRALLASVVGVSASLGAAPAFAQMAHVPETDWRQLDRHDAVIRAAQKATFTVEIRFGPYLPDVDSGVPASAPVGMRTPFTDVFGLNCGATTPVFTGSVSPRVLGGVEVDYHPIRIPFVGSLGPGVGWSFTSFSNNAQLSSSTRSAPVCSAENTTLTIMPMYGAAVLRADELMRRTGIPIVPYGKFGVGVAWWRSSNDLGTEQICGTGAAARCTSATTPVVAHGTGLTPSLHFAVGAALALNFLEPQASARLDASTGVHHAYVFGEYYNDKLQLFANALHVEASSFVGGLAVDF
jgi:hypothetical protein